MGWPDYIILSVIALSVLVGLIRGFIREAFALVVWTAAFVIAFKFSAPTADLMAETIELPSARTALAFGGLFLAVLLVGGLITFLVGQLVDRTGLSGTDRLLGAVFGAGRGLVLVVLVLLVAGFTPIPRDQWWREAPLVQSLLPLVSWSSRFLPDSVLDYLDLYGEEPTAEAAAGPEVL
ncbi:MAG: CvpA family protein [Xanthomonadales bacterium]|nr:CvpA family protein [Xanthomonadales bacterium]NIN60719.1 CvpA family protein [Xanthomonadales bacterium]NIN76081.1 CvpA family protein [Xanthomonadales bacterium]NIO15302.1 CvpA family protein [Xanthomonadales bacterium]NIP13112.1 CvpA family protein [Xanthomonadales bacterium]